ncbi:MAG: pitrilysin family protein [Verrucomicrobiota bacterium]
MSLQHTFHQLANGLKIATVEMPHMASASVGLWVNLGSRNENPDQHGMAHLVEHMLFKGTPSRSAEEISRQIEGLGASIDGFTVEDHTAYQAKSPANQFGKLFEVLADFYRNPTVDPAELESERQVIHEEIAMVRDQPSHLIEDLISEATWGAMHPLGRSITGTDQSLDAFQRTDVLSFFQEGYCGANTVISVAGNIDSGEILDQVSTCFDTLHPGTPANFQAAIPPLDDHCFREGHDHEQVHVALSFPAVDRFHTDRFAYKLLNVILGENMSSRLFQELREKRGLCYEIQSDFTSFSDGGIIQIYLALNPDHLEEALQTIDLVTRDLLQKGVSSLELKAAQSFIVGQSQISLENTASQMMWAGESFLFFDEWKDPDEAHRDIEETSLDQVNEAAKSVFGERRFASALIGDYTSNSLFDRWRRAAV